MEYKTGYLVQGKSHTTSIERIFEERQEAYKYYLSMKADYTAHNWTVTEITLKLNKQTEGNTK